MTLEHLANEAKRLLTDEVLMAAFEAVKQDAYRELAGVDAADTVAVLRLQQRVVALDEIRSQLQAHIVRAGNPEPGQYA